MFHVLRDIYPKCFNVKGMKGQTKGTGREHGKEGGKEIKVQKVT
jgi:hypothetical protein